MSTKRAAWLAKDCRYFSNQKDFGNKNNSNDFKDFCLNQNCKFQFLHDGQLKSKKLLDNNHSSNAIHDTADFVNHNNYSETSKTWRKNDLLMMNKSNHSFDQSYLPAAAYQKDKTTNSFLQKEKNNNLSKSTLSLHISAYENATTTSSSSSSNKSPTTAAIIVEKEVADLKKDFFDIFPRQQKVAKKEEKSIEAEVMEFKLTRKPLNLNVGCIPFKTIGSLRTTPVAYRGFKPGRGTGDKGSSSLFNNERRWKDDEAFQALGNTDELSSFLGICREYSFEEEDSLKDVTEVITRIQCILQDLGSHIATPPSSSTKKQERTKFDEKFIKYIDQLIDEYGNKTPTIRSFILPGGGILASHLQYARALCRRAERSLVPLIRDEAIDENALIFLNRLSDLLFVLGRYACLKTYNYELSYSPPLKNVEQLEADVKATKLAEKKKGDN